MTALTVIYTTPDHLVAIHARGIENMPEARATREAAGMVTVHDDVWTYEPDGRAAGLIASPPCQTFSLAGKGAGRAVLEEIHRAIASGAYRSLTRLRGLGMYVGDERTSLVLTPMHFATTGGYEWLAFEQVPTVLPVWEACAAELRTLGWHTWTGYLNAEQYGVPQTRKRAVLLASLTCEVAPPTPTHSRYYVNDPTRQDLGVGGWISMADGLGWGLTESPSPCITNSAGRGLAGGSNSRKTLHRARDEGRWIEKPDWCFKSPAPTVAADPRIAPRGCKHPQPGCCSRYPGKPGLQFGPGTIRLEVHEAGILQSFPADHPWQGTKGKQFLQAGNAIPPGLALPALASVARQRAEVAA